MSIVDFAFNYVVVFLIVLTILVFVHEWGHYWIARRCGVRVEVFSIGFGPEIYGWTDKNDTRWKISAIPLGAAFGHRRRGPLRQLHLRGRSGRLAGRDRRHGAAAGRRR